MLKQMTTVMAGALLAIGAWSSFDLPQQQAAQAREMCPSVSVSSRYAYLKTGPALGYKTARLAYRGETLTLTGAAPKAGWQQVKTNKGMTYWVHQSVVHCQQAGTSTKCANVKVTGPSGAYLKAYPTLASRTYRVARRGEVLALESSGNPYEYNGWYLVRAKAGQRYWAHNSVMSCVN